MHRTSILVTGASGFIGQHLIPKLLKEGNSITATYRSRPIPTNSSSADIKVLAIENIDGQTDWTEALQGVSVVIHLAARAHVLNESSVDPTQEFNRVNVEGTRNLFEQSVAAGVQQFVFLSSIGAMVTLTDGYLDETSPCLPDSPYGKSKLLAEQVISQLAVNSKTRFTILRPTLVYGPGNPGNMERLLSLVDRGIPLPLGAIRNQRSLIYVKNLVDIIACSLLNPSAYDQTFIVSDGQDVSTPALIKMIARSLGHSGRLIPIPVKIIEILGNLLGKQAAVERLKGSLAVNSQKVRQTLNWSPAYSLSDGLQETADWFQAK